jgi:hypothetical protein
MPVSVHFSLFLFSGSIRFCGFSSSYSPLSLSLSCLFVSYLYYYENDCSVIQVHYIDALIQLINENFATDRSAILPATEAHYKNTLGK